MRLRVTRCLIWIQTVCKGNPCLVTAHKNRLAEVFNMDSYLETIQKSLEDLSSFRCVHVVVGNESCDLDSAVSALTYAFYLSQTITESETLALPLLNIPKSRYDIRTETVFCFNKLNIQPENLIFLNQLDLPTLAANGRLKLTLVDHNVLTGQLVPFENCVVKVVDHHVKERAENDGVTLKLDFVGSCCTLVAEELLNDPDFTVDETVAELLYGTILIDTVNRLPEAGKITPHDDAVLERLRCVIPDIDGDKLFADIQTAKLDMSSLTNMDILEKDLKIVSGVGMVIAMSSVTMDMQELLSRPDFKDDLETFCSTKVVDVAVVMTMCTDKEGQPARQIAVFSTNRIYRDQIADVLDNCGDLDLDLEPVFAPFEDICVFLQGNIEASRKIVMPILGSFLHGDCSPDVASKDFVPDQDVAIATEGFSSLSNIIESSELNTESDLGKIRTSTKVAKTKGEHSSKAGYYGNTQVQNAGQTLVSGQRSSANSSTLFDFLTSGSSELMDPFSSVEDNNAIENSPVKKDSNMSDIGNLINTESSAGVDFNTEKSSETASKGENNFNPFLGPLSKSSETKNNNVDSKSPFSNILDDFDPLESNGKADSNSYVTFDPLGTSTDTSDNNPFGPNVTGFESPFGPNVTGFESPFGPNVTGFESPFGPNVTISAPTNNPFLQNDSTEVLAEKLLEPHLSSDIQESNPLGPKYTQECSSSNPFLLNDTVITTDIASQDPFGTNEAKPAPVTTISDPFGLLEHQSSNSSEVEDDDEQARLDYLGIGTDGGPRAKARKSISLIVEFDRESDDDNLAELDEADFFDKVPTPEAEKSGSNSPFINPNISVPFERLRSGRSSESGSRFPSVATPPNSVMEDGLEITGRKDHDLPSFNSAAMVERIKNKKKNMITGDGSAGSCEIGLVSTPYTPQNSFRDDLDKEMRGMDLLVFDDEKMTEKVKEKRNSLGIFSPVDLDSAKPLEDFGAVSKEKSNSFFNDFEEFSQSSDLLTASSVPSAPANSYIEKTGEYMSKDSVSELELFDKLTYLQGSADTDDDSGLLDFLKDVKITTGNPENLPGSEKQTGLQFLCDMSDENANQSSTHDKADLCLQLDRSATTKSKLVEEMAQAVAVETVSTKMTVDILHEAVDRFPDMENLSLAECVATEVLTGDNSHWTDQGSGDSGIASNDSPQQARPKSPKSPRSPMCRRGNEYQYSVETEYLPNMDPLHGNLNIVTSPSSQSQTIETDADKEVVESESFRKFSRQGEQIVAKETISEETAPQETETNIRSMIIQENLVSCQPSLDRGSPDEKENGPADNLIDIYDVSVQKDSESMNEDSPINSDSDDRTVHTEMPDSLLNTGCGDSTKHPEMANIDSEDKSKFAESHQKSMFDDRAGLSEMLNTTEAAEEHVYVSIPATAVSTIVKGEVMESTKMKDTGIITSDSLDKTDANSISPDTSSSFASTTDSESELITVRENLVVDVVQKSPDTDDRKTEFETEPEDKGRPSDMDEFTADIETCHQDIGGSEINAAPIETVGEVNETLKSKQDENAEILELNESNAEYHYEKAQDITDMTARPDKSVNEPEEPGAVHESVTLNLTDVSMTTSTLTVETVSPVDTPDEEHAAGFYEVNPEMRETNEMNTSVLNDSFFSTNLGDNETGFYEINAENMIDNSPMTENDFPEVYSFAKIGGDIQETVSVEKIEGTPAINIADFDDEEGESSDDDSENTQFYDMNAKLQGTVLQNIDIGHAFSPIESPNDEIVNLNYQINPMISDNDIENTDEESDNADDLFTNYTEGPLCVNTSLRHDEKFIELAETMVTEAITGALDTFQEIQFKKNEDFIKSEIASAMGEENDNESSDSDNSSTTTEGSYRIPHSLEESPVMSPEVDSFMREHVSQGVKHIVKEGKAIREEDNGIPEGTLAEELRISEDVKNFDFMEDSAKISEAIGQTVDISKKNDNDDIINGNVYSPDMMNKYNGEESVVEGFSGDYKETDRETSYDAEAASKDLLSGKSAIIENNSATAKANDDDLPTGHSRETGTDSFPVVHKQTDEKTIRDMKSELQHTKDGSAEANDQDSHAGVSAENVPNIEVVDVKILPNIETVHDEVSLETVHDEVALETLHDEVAMETVHDKVTLETVNDEDALETLHDEVAMETVHDKVALETVNDEVALETVHEEVAVEAVHEEVAMETVHEEVALETVHEEVAVEAVHEEVAVETVHEEVAMETKPPDFSMQYVTRKEIFYTSAGRMSISIDSVVDPPGAGDQVFSVQGPDIIPEVEEPVDEDDDVNLIEEGKAITAQQSVKPATQDPTVATQGSHGKMKDMEETQEWHEDPIPGMAAQEDGSSDSESDSDSDSEYTKPVRPDSLLHGGKRKKRIAANMVSHDSTDDLVEGVDDLPTPDDLSTPDDMEGEELEWEDDTPMTPIEPKKFAEYREEEIEREQRENTQFRKVEIAGKDYRVDMHVIEPYKKVLSHGGYYGDGLNAIILFCGCYLPDRGRRDYQYVMDNLFLYVISTLELLVAEDYMIVYFHGATPRRQMPSFGWLKRCYQMIDRRLRKNLKALLMVHPTLWLKTVVMMTKPFISSKFSSKLRFVKTLHELGKIVPMEYIYVPDPVTQYDTRLKQHRTSSSSSTPISPTSPS